MEFASNAGVDYFLILNNDTIIDAEALTELCKTAETHEDVGFVTGKVYYYQDPTKLQTAGRLNDSLRLSGNLIGFREYDVGQYDFERDFDFVDDVFLLVKREVYEKVGGYDKNFFLYWEETDWCARVRRAGFRILYTPKAKIWHKGNLTTTDGIAPSAFFFLTRNQIPFMWRNANLDQFVKFSFNLLWKECPIKVARYVKHKSYNYASAYLRGIISGYLWIFGIYKRN